MIENTELNVEKGSYNHPQPQGMLTLKQYIFSTNAGKRTLLLRFANESPLELDGFEFVIVELNRRGDVITRHRLFHSDLRIAAGGTYCPTSGVVVSDECADFRIKVISIRSGIYRYTSRRGQLVAHYDRQRRGTTPKNPRHGYTEVRSARSKDGRVFTLIAVIAVLIICVTSAMARYHLESLAKAPDINGVEQTHISL